MCETRSSTALGDTLAGVLAGVVIFPAVFAYGYDPQGGPGLTFVTLPRVFSEMPFGQLIGTVFFLTTSVAGFTSLIASFEILCDACHHYWNWIFWIRWVIPAFILLVLIYGWWDFFY